MGQISEVAPEDRVVRLSDGTVLAYDYLVIATGTSPRPEETPGMLGAEWRESVFDFYTLEGSTALAEKLRTWEGGRLVVHITEMPIKCPVAPLEFAFLADSYFKERGLRDKVEITYVTPLDGAFTKPIASKHLSGMLEERNIALEPELLHRIRRQRLEVDRVVRRAGHPVRPSGDRAAQQGRRLCPEERAGR